MKNSELIIIGSIVSLITGIVIYVVYKIFKREKYIKLKNVGYFPIIVNKPQKGPSNNDDEPEHKYDSHRYKQRRPYNFLSQQNNRNQ
jgi:hypothetical protein